ncbi:hypothetical protein PILCRDRAFT_810414 [Piloderma croceum F 1598]|uniref:Uncharacterized protein n=1 Tax=Piloderma croceum (strain F 1598) TaxID=765440 RepID=A0A0C3C0J5_PILCF|nr:hypothetical protein PILCRDRAFT_810414 [Piloderma croceum F 1598]
MEHPRLSQEPCIPVELWLRIFAIATRLPADLIDPTTSTHPLTNGPETLWTKLRQQSSN